METIQILISTLTLVTLVGLHGQVGCDEYLPTSHFLNPMGHGHDGPPTCEPIKIGLCLGVGYNDTVMPNQNMVGHMDGQKDAEAVLQTFTPLIQYGCSPHLKLLLCSAFVPMCTDKVPQPIGPCRGLCLSVKTNCEPIMKEFGFSWPPSLDCNLFHPENNHENMCIPGIDAPPSSSSSGGGGGGSGWHTMSGSGSSGSNPPGSRHKSDGSSSGGHKGFGSMSGLEKNSIGTIDSSSSSGGGFGGFFGAGSPGGSSSSSILLENHNHNHNHNLPSLGDISFHGNGNTDEDGIHHHPPLLSSPGNNRHGSGGVDILGPGHGIGIGIGLGRGQGSSAISGGISCGLKVARKGECWIPCDSVRGKVTSTSSMHGPVGSNGYPANGGFFLSHEQEFGRRYAFIWAVLSLTGAVIAVFLATTLARTLSSPAERPVVYIALCQIFYSVGVIIGSTNVGTGGSPGPCVFDKVTGMDLMAKGSLVPPSCSLVFLLTYFFGIASSLWWVMLCLSWLLSLNKSFGSSLESREWSMYHLFTWATASVLTCTVLLLKSVDSDELTGICGVGFQENSSFLYFMVIPFAACLGNGLALLLTGFLLRYRSRYRKKARYNRRNGGIVGDYEVVSSSLGPSFTNLQQKRLDEKSKTTWNRVLIFALVHLVPVFTHVGTLFYEMQSRPSWSSQEARPNLQVFLLKVNMNLIPGLTTGVWILSIYSWKSWLLKLLSCSFPSRLDCNKLIQQTVINFSGSGVSSSHSSNNNRNRSGNPTIPSLNQLTITDPATAALNPFHTNGISSTSTFNPGARSLPPIPNPNPNTNPTSNSSSVNPVQSSHSHTHTHHNHNHNHSHSHGHSHDLGQMMNGINMRTETWRRGETIV